MSKTCPLNAIAIDVVGQYSDAARHVVAACRTGDGEPVSTSC
jgi:hypothetical protein